MEIFEPVHHASEGAVFTVVVDGVRDRAAVGGERPAEGRRAGPVSLSRRVRVRPPYTYLRGFTQAAWQTSLGDQAAVNPGRRARRD